VARRRQGRRHARLAADGEVGFEVRYREYPRRERDLLPTRLGNIMRSAELYPGDDGRYGIDAVFFWPRLYAVLPEPMRDSLQEARSSLDLMLVTSGLSLLFLLIAACLLPFAGMGQGSILIGVVGAGLVALLTYRGAVRAAVVFAELVRTSFDLYRGSLLAQLGYDQPTSLDKERELWKNLGEQLYRRIASDPSVLRAASAGHAQPVDGQAPTRTNDAQ
jgi:hypothetical protein